ncbi:MAG TPA: carboxypeptidase-like regulatory domain-containing protein [Anaerolineae bacterium]|nr:carboxypeptidase-like regulatory domain-containing protein [Anaerolineae bacterium]
MKRCLLFLACLILVGSSLFACAPDPPAFGILEGHVTIGPLAPVVREGQAEPTPAPEVYAGREIVVYERDGRTEFIRLKIDANGNYRTELPVGTYVIDINHLGLDMAEDLPQEIEITQQGSFRLDIAIDTGIR